LTAGENGGGYWYCTYHYAYNPGYYARRYPAPLPGYESYYRYQGYGSASKTDPGMSSRCPYLRYAPPARTPTDWRTSK
jgi:hypothetical protein